MLRRIGRLYYLVQTFAMKLACLRQASRAAAAPPPPPGGGGGRCRRSTRLPQASQLHGESLYEVVQASNAAKHCRLKNIPFSPGIYSQ